ncbi:MAG: prolipoprotein diacylglyceryl transferase family protein [Myxococcota bacterium]
MWPTLTQIQTAMGPLPVNTYGIFMMLAFSGAFGLIHVRARLAGIHSDRLIPGYIAAAVGGMLGARLMYAIAVDWERTLAEPWSLFSCAGFAVYGGVIGGALGVLAFAKMSGLPMWRTADLAAPGVILGMGVGRMGCFFAGCCHGGVAPTPVNPVGLLPSWFTGGQLWLSKTAPFLTNEVHGGVGRLHDIPLYPTQLWTAVVLTSFALFLVWLWPRRRFDGQIIALMLIVEPPFRSLVETFRADERGYLVSWSVSDAVASWLPGMAQAGTTVSGHGTVGITTAQATAALFVAVGIAIFVNRRNAGVGDVKVAEQVDETDLLEELA